MRLRLNEQATQRIENFLREYHRRESLVLPPFVIYSGRSVHLLAALFRFGALTFGRRILIAPALLKRDQNDRLIVPGWLIAHEATHVLQYKERGTIKFLCAYTVSYLRALKCAKNLNAAARMSAYFDIGEEIAAREVEEAYKIWSSNKANI